MNQLLSLLTPDQKHNMALVREFIQQQLVLESIGALPGHASEASLALVSTNPDEGK